MHSVDWLASRDPYSSLAVYSSPHKKTQITMILSSVVQPSHSSSLRL